MKIYSDDRGMEFGIEKYAMQIMRSRKRQMTEEIELPNPGNIRTLWETYKYLWILEADAIKQVEMKEKNKKEYLRRTRKLLENKLYGKKSHQRDKHLSCPPRKIRGTILKLDEGRTSTNWPENKKTHDDA